MAPVNKPSHDIVERDIKNVIQEIFQAMVQTHAYDTTNRPSSQVLENTFKALFRAIQQVHTTVNQPSTHLPLVPPELIQYVDNGRNPDIYTREFVELARKGNQLMNGKMQAFGSFRDVLAGEMGSVFPELREDVGMVLEETGGRRGVLGKGEEGV